MSGEIAETEKLLRLATYSGLRTLLEGHLASLKPSEAPTPPEKAAMEAVPPTAPSTLNKETYVTITDFAWDQGNSTISVYVELDDVGTVKDRVSCEFTRDTFDLKVKDLNGKHYRLLQDNLDKDVVVDKCKFIVKANKVVIKLAKVKGEYSYDNWTTLASKKTKEDKQKKASATKENPMGGIMDMMKDMYETGDDNMKKIIGEAMEKSRRGETMTPDDKPIL